MAELSGRPLLGTTRDRSLAVGRAAELDVVGEAVQRGLNVLLSAERGGGTTTMLHRLARKIAREYSKHPRFVNASNAASADELLHQVAGDLIPTVSVVGSGSAYARFSRYGGLPEGVVALVDNMSVRLAEESFGTFRDEFWAVPIVWVVTCTEGERLSFLRLSADAFFDVTARLPPLTDVESASLLRRRTSKDELSAAALRTAVAAAGGNPRALVNAARAIVLAGGDTRTITEASIARERIESSLSRSALILLSELRSLGPSSASDRELQERTGWTRARLVQVFAELDRALAIEADHVRDGRSGRPRKVYRPRY